MPVFAVSTPFTGTISNVSLGGAPGGRCGAGLLISFAPDALAASGTSNFGTFSFVASHCIAGFPPGPFSAGEFVWTFGGGTLSGTYTGLLGGTGVPGHFTVSEDIVFTGGTGTFLGAAGTALSTGTLAFGALNGVPVSVGESSFSGTLSVAPVPEPEGWALMAAGLACVGLLGRRRRTRAQE